MFADTVGGANASANLYSLIETAKANNVEPYRYRVASFKKLPLAQTVDDDEALLLPWNIGLDGAQASPCAHRLRHHAQGRGSLSAYRHPPHAPACSTPLRRGARSREPAASKPGGATTDASTIFKIRAATGKSGAVKSGRLREGPLQRA
ncbi:transposase domain-containing protein [Variovorax sp. OK202]|uniref:transposase domain-containing protein n=1 Tax=unclassified Variovorax TaxID=663243 RepID=UPI000A7E0412